MTKARCTSFGKRWRHCAPGFPCPTSEPGLPPPVPVELTTLPTHDCNYLPGRLTTLRAFRIRQMPGGLYDHFMDAGFRRSGLMVYQPICEGCRECIPIRVPVDRFKSDKSQRRCVTKNADLVVTVGVPNLTDEKLLLYQRYVTQWHGHGNNAVETVDRDSLQSFLYQSPVETLEFCYRSPQGNLLGVGIVDVSPKVLSSVYFYFDPDQRDRSLGTFAAMYEIDWAGRHDIAYYYLGFWIRDCNTMKYKSRFRPAQTLGPDGVWRDLPDR